MSVSVCLARITHHRDAADVTASSYDVTTFAETLTSSSDPRESTLSNVAMPAAGDLMLALKLPGDTARTLDNYTHVCYANSESLETAAIDRIRHDGHKRPKIQRRRLSPE